MIKELPAEKRTTFSEVITTSSSEDIVEHAKQALKSCPADCTASCPIGVDIHAVLGHVSRKEFQKARDVLDKDQPFPSVCGRVCNGSCHASSPCADKFKHVERYLGDSFSATTKKVKAGKQHVAIVGAGVAGLTCARVLRENGVNVKVIEATATPGGNMSRAVPEFRLPSKAVDKDVGSLISDVELSTKSVGGAMYPLEELSSKMDAVIVATGANKPTFMGIPGEHLPNVHCATDFIASPRKKSQDRTFVVGGGDLAVDAARVARRLGDTVTVLFHKDLGALPAHQDNVRHAQQEGVQFMLLTRPLRILGSGAVTGIECVQMMLAESDLDDTKVAVPMENSEFTLPADKIIMAIGLEPNPTMARYSPLRTVGKGRLWTNEHHQTSMPNVFAAGEIAIGSNPVEKAIGHAKECAADVLRYLKGELKEEE